ncbi:hypothetical protein L3X38_008900 [Prunus dulcis]|uniref:TIR domain-containing protein n=1 Tax=Prunus dulcis TaxID=3755 RepID=A0AAD4ZXC5_PRUDU|nr:hypothetical protein L3X38_008900 [Prunus dulcis]
MRSKASFWQTEEAGCLRELEKIMERRRTRGQMVWPIFYDVDPKDVGKQTVKDCNWEEMMQSWRKSLTEAANLSGLVSAETDGYLREFVTKIVDEITRKLKSTCVDVATEQVELDSSMQEITNIELIVLGSHQSSASYFPLINFELKIPIFLIYPIDYKRG